MSNLDALASETSAGEKSEPKTPAEMAAALTGLLKLERVGLAVTGTRMVGKGARASVDIYLSDGTSIEFEKFGDLMKAQILTAEVLATTGALVPLKNPDAAQAAQLVRRLAQHVATESADDRAREWGDDFLRRSIVLDVDMGDQADRWRAFEKFDAQPDLEQQARAGLESIANKALTVCDSRTGERYVKTGTFMAYVRQREGSSYPPSQVVTLMGRVGWFRPGADGDVKATRPGFAETRRIRFWRVPADWGGQGAGPGRSGENPSAKSKSRQVPPSRREEPMVPRAHAISKDLPGPRDLDSRNPRDLPGPDEAGTTLDDSIGGAW